VSEKDISHRNEADYLKEMIEKSGFPLEIEVCSLIKSLDERLKLEFGARISTSAYYLDKDEGKGRELDVKAAIPIDYFDKEKGVKRTGIYLHLLIQCKSVPGNAWVFFRTPHEIIPHCIGTSLADALEWMPRSLADFELNPQLHYQNIPITTIYDEYILDDEMSNKKDSNLFESLVSLTKATAYELENENQDFREELRQIGADIKNDPPDYAHLFYPIVVFDGKLYLTEKTTSEGFVLTQIDHLGLFMDYVSRHYDMVHVIDIVQRKTFGKFIDKLCDDARILTEQLQNGGAAKLRKDVSDALNNYFQTGFVLKSR
jgi:hypothetical protein